jgi:hypothetical protein
MVDQRQPDKVIHLDDPGDQTRDTAMLAKRPKGSGNDGGWLLRPHNHRARDSYRSSLGRMPKLPIEGQPSRRARHGEKQLRQHLAETVAGFYKRH